MILFGDREPRHLAACAHCNEGLVCGECLRPDCIDHEGETDQGWLTMAFCPLACGLAMRAARCVARPGATGRNRYWRMIARRILARRESPAEDVA